MDSLWRQYGLSTKILPTNRSVNNKVHVKEEDCDLLLTNGNETLFKALIFAILSVLFLNRAS